MKPLLVLVFSANEQSFGCGVQIAAGVQKARRNLEVQRPPLAVIPIPGRFDGRDEVDDAQLWLTRFANELKPFYDDWLPKGLNPRQILELTKIPYVTKFSFGEPLPVITQGTTDPEFPGFYLENITRLIVSDFQDAQQIVSPESPDRSDKIAELRSLLMSIPISEEDIAATLRNIEKDTQLNGRFSALLEEAGVSLLRQQKFASAEAYFRRALAMCMEGSESYYSAVQSIMSHLGELLTTMGRLDEAELLYRQIVDLDSNLDPSQRASTYTQLANVYRKMGRFDESLNWYRRVLELEDNSVVLDHTVVLAIYNSIASLYRDMGQMEDAVNWYEKTLKVIEKNGSNSDSTTLAAYSNLAGVYREMNRLERAVFWYERALGAVEMSGRLSDSAALATYNNLAAVYLEMGRVQAAMNLYERALRAIEGGEHQNNPITLPIYNGLARACRQTGQLGAAVGWYEKGILAAEANGRSGGLAALAMCNNLAGIFREMGDKDQAINSYLRVLQLAGKNGRGSARARAILGAHNGLAEIYREIGRIGKAISWYEKALDIAQNMFGPNSVQTANQLNNLADILIAEKRVVEAESLLRRALESVNSSPSSDSPVASRIRSTLAQILSESGRSEEAELVSGKRRYDVFVSYASEDASIIQSLVEKLIERGIRVWFDRWELRLGDSVIDAVTEAIQSAPTLIVCIGKGKQPEELSLLSRMSDIRNKIIIPVLLPGSNLDAMPTSLLHITYLNLIDGLTEEGINRLAATIMRRKRPF